MTQISRAWVEGTRDRDRWPVIEFTFELWKMVRLVKSATRMRIVPPSSEQGASTPLLILAQEDPYSEHMAQSVVSA